LKISPRTTALPSNLPHGTPTKPPADNQLAHQAATLHQRLLSELKRTFPRLPY
jgi:hypothetical protein